MHISQFFKYSLFPLWGNKKKSNKKKSGGDCVEKSLLQNSEQIISKNDDFLALQKEVKNLKKAADAHAKMLANFSNLSIKRATLLFKDAEFARAEEILRCVDEVLPEERRHLTTYGNSLASQDLFQEAEVIFRRQISLEPENNTPVKRLADMLAGQGRHSEAADVLEKFTDSTRPDSNIRRRIQTHRNLAGMPNAEISAKRDEALRIHASAPPLSKAQEKILTSLVKTGIAVTSFEELFSEKHLWDLADVEFRRFAEDDGVKKLSTHISSALDFKDDPELSKLFKPSVINYKNFFGNLTTAHPVVKIYSSEEILGIANAYNGMASKIRNMHLWINPPLHSENINGRKGSQLWHRDQEDSKILKCFIYFSDVDERSGATEYAINTAVGSAGLKDRVLPYPCTTGYPMEKSFYSRVPSEDFVRADGKKGTIVFIDTNGFHCGGFVKEISRYIAMCTYLRPVSPYVDTNSKVDASDGLADEYTAISCYGLS